MSDLRKYHVVMTDIAGAIVAALNVECMNACRAVSIASDAIDDNEYGYKILASVRGIIVKEIQK